MTKEDKARNLMLECIQHLQQHPNLEPPTQKSYLSIVYGESLRKCGMTAEQVCVEWDQRLRKRPLQALHAKAKTE
jgi:hypothetical protein